jgi:hypothetical protein
MAAIVPIIMGGRVLQVAAPRAIALIEAGVARMLPSMRTVGSQSAGSSAAGPFYSRGAANLPAMADRPGLIGKGLAGGAAAGSLAMGGPEASVPPEGRVPIPPGMISMLDERGAAPPAPPQYANSDMSAEFLDGPSAFRQAAPMMATPEAMRLPISYGQPERRAVQVAREVVGANAPPPPPRPAETERPAAGPSSRDLWSRYNETESPADFARADAAMRAGRAEGGGIPEGMMGARPMPSLDLPPMDGPPPMGDMPPLGGMSPASKPTAGTGAGGRDAAINKALEIIHHLVMRGR